jgi:hypothetical protein
VPGIFAPLKTRAQVMTRLNQEIVRALNRDEVKERCLSAGVESALGRGFHHTHQRRDGEVDESGARRGDQAAVMRPRAPA